MSEEQEDRPTPHPFDYITRSAVQDLWGIGFTIVKRDCGRLDIFELPNGMTPAGRAYQWFHLVEDRAVFEHTGWSRVPASRHDGWFMPFGQMGPIEVSGLGLFEKPKFEVDQERAAQVTAAQQKVADWAKQAGAEGLSGSFSIDGQTFDVGASPEPLRRDKGTKTINTTVGVPADMFPHMNEVFAERDRLYAEMERVWSTDGKVFTDDQWSVYVKYQRAAQDDPAISKGPTMNALLLPYAVKNVRAKLKEGKTDE